MRGMWAAQLLRGGACKCNWIVCIACEPGSITRAGHDIYVMNLQRRRWADLASIWLIIVKKP